MHAECIDSETKTNRPGRKRNLSGNMRMSQTAYWALRSGAQRVEQQICWVRSGGIKFSKLERISRGEQPKIGYKWCAGTNVIDFLDTLNLERNTGTKQEYSEARSEALKRSKTILKPEAEHRSGATKCLRLEWSKQISDLLHTYMVLGSW